MIQEEGWNDTRKEDLSKVNFFQCHVMGQYVVQCSLNKGKGMKQVVDEIAVGVEVITS